jgi:hypothetical protein
MSSANCCALTAELSNGHRNTGLAARATRKFGCNVATAGFSRYLSFSLSLPLNALCGK